MPLINPAVLMGPVASQVISSVVIGQDTDIPIARRRTMKVAELLGLEGTVQTRVATALSEVIRSMAGMGDVRVHLAVDRADHTFEVVIERTLDDEPLQVPDLSSLVDDIEVRPDSVVLSTTLPQRVDVDVIELLEGLLDSGALSPLEALRERNQQLLVALDDKARAEATASLALEAARLGIWEMDGHGLLFMDDRCRRLHELPTAGSVSLAHLSETIDGEGRLDFEKTIEEARAAAGPVGFEVEYDVGDRRLATRGRCTIDGRMMAAVLDVTALHRREEDAKRQAQFLQEMVGVVSHDLKNPLQVMKMGATLLSETGSLDDRQKKLVQRLRHTADRASRLVVDLLDFTRDRLGTGIPVQKRKGDLAALSREVVAAMRIAHADLNFTVSFADDCIGHFDPDRMGQVIQNLLDNAAEHSPLEGTVETRIENAGDDILLSVINGGDPITADLLPYVFSPLTQGEEGSKKRIGLGLYIVRAIAEAHGGGAEVESTEGGTRFTVRLPRED